MIGILIVLRKFYSQIFSSENLLSLPLLISHPDCHMDSKVTWVLLIMCGTKQEFVGTITYNYGAEIPDALI